MCFQCVQIIFLSLFCFSLFCLLIVLSLSFLCLFCCLEVPPTSYLSAKTSSFAFPLLPAEGLKGSLLYFDGQMNDSRLCLSLALSPTVSGFVEGMQPAAASNHLAAKQLIKDEQGKIVRQTKPAK